jgi:hypothetical protein
MHIHYNVHVLTSAVGTCSHIATAFILDWHCLCPSFNRDIKTFTYFVDCTECWLIGTTEACSIESAVYL